jgi:hypothetical protein
MLKVYPVALLVPTSIVTSPVVVSPDVVGVMPRFRLVLLTAIEMTESTVMPTSTFPSVAVEVFGSMKKLPTAKARAKQDRKMAALDANLPPPPVTTLDFNYFFHAIPK